MCIRDSFFSSRLVTDTSFVEGTKVPGAQVGIARKGHYCSALRVRLSDVLEARGRAPDSDADVCGLSDEIEILGSSVPEDVVGRGATDLHQPRDFEPMTAVSFEGLCALSAPELVNPMGNALFDSREPEQILDLMTSTVLGFPEGSARYVAQREVMGRLYDAQVAAPECADAEQLERALASSEPRCGMGLSPTDALRNIWTITCQSPSLTGLGL